MENIRLGMNNSSSSNSSFNAVARARALKRSTKDYKELTENPQRGIAIQQLGEDCFSFVVNIEVISGPYIGIKLHMLLKISENYPIKAPTMEIYPHQYFSEYGFHHHIFGTRFCIDMLSEAIMNSNQMGSGWTPAYTFKSLLWQIQNFVADPDMDKDHLDQKLKQLPLAFAAQ